MQIINCIIVLILSKLTIAKAPIDVIFFVRSQDTTYQNQLCRNLKENILKQSYELQPSYNIKVHVLHEIFNYPGDWTIHNLIPQLTNEQIGVELLNDQTRWIIFCEDTTRVKVKLLMERLSNENHTQPIYLGHPLYDREPTIIHHFAFFENPKWFPYPMLRAGVVFSMPLFKSIADLYANHNNNKRLKQQQEQQHTTSPPVLQRRSEFSIDAAHELARFIYDNVQILLPAIESSSTTTKRAAALNDNKSPHVNVYHRNLKTATKTAAGSSRTARASILSNADAVASVAANDDVDDVDLPHSDFRTNEIVDNGKEEVKFTSSNVGAINTAKRQKIILKKASYICPKATWETGSMNKKHNYKSNNKNNVECAMYAAEQTTATSSMTCIPVQRDRIYFAVKTCSKYHKERLPIIQATWAPYAKHINYFSDKQDDTIPTINTGVPNVEMGHCAKTLQILKLALRDIENYNNNYKNYNKNQDIDNKRLHHVNQAQHEKNHHRPHQIQWLFLTDDDTILSVSGVCQVLGCFDSMHGDDDIYLGERYGYRLYAQDGFNYITGGGGIVFSLSVVKLILQHCSCPSPSAPDDMILGSCLHSLQLRALHSSRFHQARPNDYPLAVLEQEPPISFHKFWQLDPIDVYNRWFSSQDRQLMAEEELRKSMASMDYHHKNRKLLDKTESLNLNDIPVSFVASLHHSKERHVDL